MYALFSLNAALHKTAQRTNTQLETFFSFFEFVRRKTLQLHMADGRGRALKDHQMLQPWEASSLIGREPPHSSTLL